MTLIPKSVLLLALLLLMGAVRMPYEQALTEELRDAGLMREQLELSTRDMIDQTSAVAALGGMRTLVATLLNLRAHVLFERQRWDELEMAYRAIVDLAPRTRHYWETGSWHLAYNAASHYLLDSSIPGMRRREQWRHSIERGRDFLELAIRNNPKDWRLHAALGHLLRDPNKLPAFRERNASLLQAARSYARAIELGSSQPRLMERLRFYCLSRVEGYEQEALELGRELYSDPRHRTPTLLMLVYALECRADPGCDVEALALKLFGDAKSAYEALKLHWQRTREGYPMDGVARGLARLERLLGIPTPQSVLAHPPSPPIGVDQWFGQD